jgi:branched-chain amino acid transport system substrate-binding protein
MKGGTKMRKLILISVVLVLVVLSMGFWNTPVARSEEPIYFGQVMPLSGFFKPVDEGRFRGVLMAVRDLNAKGGLLGRPVEVLQYDMKSDPPLGANGAIELIDKGAAALQVASDYDIGGPAALVAQNKKIIAFSGAHDVKFGPAGIGQYAFSVGVSTAGEAAQAAEWAYKARGLRSAYVLLDNTLEYFKAMARYYKICWIRLAGGEGFAGEDKFLNSDPSIASQITRIKALSKKPDHIYLASFPPGGAMAVRQLRAAGIELPIVACIGMDGDYWLGATPNLSNFYATLESSMYGDDSMPRVNEHWKRYAEEYGKPVTSYGTEGYAIIEAWSRAVERAGTTDSDAVRRELEKFNNEPLIDGPFSYSEKVHIPLNRPMALMELQNGKWRFLRRVPAEWLPEYK